NPYQCVMQWPTDCHLRAGNLEEVFEQGFKTATLVVASTRARTWCREDPRRECDFGQERVP
ncbi:MAG: hypothetical protein M1423_06620, partial [Acidobacteria bacterium]|nr:hypothetical protein [Acidobacteriota bacterium]